MSAIPAFETELRGARDRLIGRMPRKFVDPNLSECEIWELTKEEWRAFRKQR